MTLSKKLLMYSSMKTPIAQDYETFSKISMRAKFQFDIFFLRVLQVHKVSF